MRVSTHDIADLDQREQAIMARWCSDVLERRAARARRRAVRQARDMEEESARQGYERHLSL
jgi:hypothetical protein